MKSYGLAKGRRERQCLEMKPPLLPVATLVAGVLAGVMLDKAGFVAGGTTEADGVANSRIRQKSSERGRSTEDAVLGDFLGGRAPGELEAEELYRFLYPWNEGVAFDPTSGRTQEEIRRNYQLSLLLKKVPLPVLEQTLVLARKGDVSFSLSHKIFATLAGRDWEKSMAWAAGQRDARDLKSAALDLMAETNPDRARVIYEDWLNDGTVGGSGSVATTIARHEAGRGHDALLDFLEGLPSITERPSIIELMRELPDEEVPEFLKEFQRRGMEDTTVYSMDLLMLETADTHPEEFHRWLENQEPEKRSKIQLELAIKKSQTGLTEKSKMLLNEAMASSPGGARNFVTDQFAPLVYYPELLKQAVALLPEDQKLAPEDLLYSGSYSYDNHAAVFFRANLLRTAEDQAEFLIKSFEHLSYGRMRPKDLAIFSHRLETFGLEGEPGERTRAALKLLQEKTQESEKPQPPFPEP